MKLSKEHIKLILLAAVAILLLIMVITLLRKDKEVPDHKALIEAYDKAIAANERIIQLQEEIKQELKAERDRLYARDSFLVKSLLENQPKYVSNEKRYNQITAAVSSLTKDELRRELSGD